MVGVPTDSMLIKCDHLLERKIKVHDQMAQLPQRSMLTNKNIVQNLHYQLKVPLHGSESGILRYLLAILLWGHQEVMYSQNQIEQLYKGSSNVNKLQSRYFKWKRDLWVPKSDTVSTKFKYKDRIFLHSSVTIIFFMVTEGIIIHI